MSSPRLTVITPAYNAGAFLQETIDSVLEQDYRDFDCIVIDDGSTDGTPQLLERYRGRLMAVRHETAASSAR
jgi:glycosyltransferase involved in cell wall biosynthesis